MVLDLDIPGNGHDVWYQCREYEHSRCLFVFLFFFSSKMFTDDLFF